MIRNYLNIVVSALIMLSLMSCKKEESLGDPWANLDKNENTQTGGKQEEDGYKVPKKADNIVVAHRGGSMEAGRQVYPDNSIASLRYAISLGCLGAEADIYWTKDNNVIVAHADADCKINGVYPWEHDLKYIRSLGRLANGEMIPTLEEYLTVLLKESICTKLWLDIKNITKPKTLSSISAKACTRACEIIDVMKANNMVEFICTGNAAVMSISHPISVKYAIPIGWMANKSPSEYRALGYSWANLSQDFFDDGFHDGKRTVQEFKKAKITLSVFTVDKDEHMDYYINYRDDLKAICTNYPAKLIEKMK